MMRRVLSKFGRGAPEAAGAGLPNNRIQTALLAPGKMATHVIHSCDVAGCHYTTPRRNNLERHRRSHSGELAQALAGLSMPW